MLQLSTVIRLGPIARFCYLRGQHNSSEQQLSNDGRTFPDFRHDSRQEGLKLVEGLDYQVAAKILSGHGVPKVVVDRGNLPLTFPVSRFVPSSSHPHQNSNCSLLNKIMSSMYSKHKYLSNSTISSRLTPKGWTHRCPTAK